MAKLGVMVFVDLDASLIGLHLNEHLHVPESLRFGPFDVLERGGAKGRREAVPPPRSPSEQSVGIANRQEENEVSASDLESRLRDAAG